MPRIKINTLIKLVYSVLVEVTFAVFNFPALRPEQRRIRVRIDLLTV